MIKITAALQDKIEGIAEQLSRISEQLKPSQIQAYHDKLFCFFQSDIDRESNPISLMFKFEMWIRLIHESLAINDFLTAFPLLAAFRSTETNDKYCFCYREIYPIQHADKLDDEELKTHNELSNRVGDLNYAFHCFKNDNFEIEVKKLNHKVAENKEIAPKIIQPPINSHLLFTKSHEFSQREKIASQINAALNKITDLQKYPVELLVAHCEAHRDLAEEEKLAIHTAQKLNPDEISYEDLFLSMYVSKLGEGRLAKEIALLFAPARIEGDFLDYAKNILQESSDKRRIEQKSQRHSIIAAI